MYLLENLTWAQAKEAFAKCKTAIIPWGSIEQHGPQLPVGTDWFVAEYMIKDLIDSDYPAIITPPMPVGFADYHTDFPGTLSFSFDLVEQMATELCKKLISYGITHVLFFNCHGGNEAPLTKVCYELRKKGFTAAVFMWYELAGRINKEWAALGHGDAAETEVVMAHKPGLVKLEGVERPPEDISFGELKMTEMNKLFFKDIMPAHFSLRISDFSKSGAIIETHIIPGAYHGQWLEDVDPERTIPMRKAVTEYVVGFLPEFEKVKFDPVCEKF